tara:strand:- start:2766 stop:3785 length:1020 start_codon:yes stop_codon:yes gene_type:complete
MKSKDLFEKNKDYIDKIITDNWDVKRSLTAKILNQKELFTMNGREWSGSNVSGYGHRILNLDKKVNQSTGWTKSPIGRDEPKQNNVLPEVFKQGGKFLVSSLNIADVFGKEHKNVIRDIESLYKNLSHDTKFTRLNFELSEYKDSSGKVNKMYLLTQDALTLIVMGYEGKKAIQFKLMYINQFNEMASHIKNEEPKIMTDAQKFLQMAQLVVNLEDSVKETKEELNNTNIKVNEIIAEKEHYKKQLNQVERSNVLPFENTTKKKITNIINTYAGATGMQIKDVRMNCYRDYNSRYSVNVITRAKNRNIPIIDCIQIDGGIDDFYNLVSEILRIEDENYN